MSPVQNTHHQYNLPLPQKRIAYRANREGVAEQFTDACASKSIEVDLELIGHYDDITPESFITYCAAIPNSKRDRSISSSPKERTVKKASSTALLRIKSAIDPTNVSSRANWSKAATSPAVTPIATITWLRESTDWIVFR